MPKTQDVIISDTSCIIILESIGNIDLLQKIYLNVTITEIISKEFGLPLPDFIKIRNPTNFKISKYIGKHCR